LDIHPALEAIVQTCLQKNPDERFQSMVDMAMAIQELDLKSPAAIKMPAAKSQPSPMPASLVPTTMGTASAGTVELPLPGRPQPLIGRSTGSDAASAGGTAVNQRGSSGAASAVRSAAGIPGQFDGSGPAPQVVRSSNTMRSRTSQNSQPKMITAVLIVAVIFGLTGLAATFYFLGSHEGTPSSKGANQNAQAPSQSSSSSGSSAVNTAPTQAVAPHSAYQVAAPSTTPVTQPATTTSVVPHIPTAADTNQSSGMHLTPSTAAGTKPAAQTGPTTATASGEPPQAHGQKIKPPAAHVAAKPPVIAHAKTTQPRKPKHQQASGGGDVGGNYVPPPVSDADRWNRINKSWSQ
jgi:hypothetical protein